MKSYSNLNNLMEAILCLEDFSITLEHINIDVRFLKFEYNMIKSIIVRVSFSKKIERWVQCFRIEKLKVENFEGILSCILKEEKPTLT